VSVRLNVGTTSTLSVSPGSLNFVHQAGGLFPAAQTLLVSTSGASLNFASSASSNGNWLSVGPTSGSTPSTLSISVNPGNLAPGTYNGSITVTAAGALNSPLTIPIQLTVTTLQAVTLNVIPNSVSFSSQQGGALPASQNLSVSTNTGTSVGYSVASSGGSWLTATPASGTTTGNVSVSVNPAGLTPGNYAGAITISAGGVQNSPVSIPINLTVTASTSLSASPGSLSFTHTGAGVPASQNVSVSSTGGSLSFTASSSASWLTVTPGSGSTPATLAIGVNPAGLAAGTYNGAITINAPAGANSPQTINVTLLVQSTDPAINAIVNGASFASGFLSAGVVVTIYGARIGPDEGVLFQATGGALPDVLADTRVLVDGSPTTLIYVQARQVNAILPFSLQGRTSARVEIEYRGRRSNAIQIQLFEAAPGLFAADGSGEGQAAALNQNGTPNSASNPADPDTFVSVFGTGGGDTDPASADGRVATGAARLRLAVSARIGNLDAEVQYAGAAPGLANGAVQFNLRVPRGLRPGNHSVAVQVGRFTSQLGITIVVR
jgi:uncharacterized protein (TIGR03437 family)